jgi:hypothetical protein
MVRSQQIWGELGGIGLFVGVDGEWGPGLGAFVVVWPFLDNGGCSSRWGTVFMVVDRRWGLSSSLCKDTGAEVRGAHAARFFDGPGVRGVGGGIVGDVAVVGNVGGGETTRWGANRVVPGGVYGLGSFLGQVSSSVGAGWAEGAGLGDLVVV